MSNPTLGEVVDVFLMEYRLTTRRTYWNDLRMMMRFVSPELTLSDVQGYDLIRAVQSYEARDSVQSVYTVNKFIKTVCRFFNWCVNTGLIEASPAGSLTYRKITDRDIQIKAMPQEVFDKAIEYYEALSSLKPQYLRHLGLFYFLYDSGARRSGAAGLKWCEISSSDDGTWTAHITEKGDLSRDVWFATHIAITMRQWRLVQKLKPGMDHVFSRDGRPIQAANLAQFFRRACKAAGVGSWGPHSVRHNFGYRLDDEGISSRNAADAMGHRDGGVTFEKNYARRDRTLARDATLRVSYRKGANIALAKRKVE